MADKLSNCADVMIVREIWTNPKSFATGCCNTSLGIAPPFLCGRGRHRGALCCLHCGFNDRLLCRLVEIDRARDADQPEDEQCQAQETSALLRWQEQARQNARRCLD